jgi:plasmid stability protein
MPRCCKKLKVLGVRLTEWELKRLKVFAEKHGRSMSAQVRQQIKTMLNTKGCAAA